MTLKDMQFFLGYRRKLTPLARHNKAWENFFKAVEWAIRHVKGGGGQKNFQSREG